jgi:hypothetical protein
MRDIENHISPFIESQFPSFYKDEGTDFIAFMKAYYEWMESNGQAIQLSRNMFEYRDIDKTIDAFVVHFKEKYLKDLPYEVSTNKRLLIKHIQDLYRTKGTQRGIELLFRLLYNVEAKVYYPGDDLLKASDGQWFIPEYIEVSPGSRNDSFVGKTVLGTTSGASAFIERIVRKRVQGKFIDVFYISARQGTFTYNERIVDASNPIVEGAPKVIGSLSELIVLNGGRDFNIGDVLTLKTGSGQQGKARVTEISTETGRVNFKIESGGFGYSTNAQVIISNTNLTLTNLTNANSSITEFERFETVRQPLATIEYSTTTNSAAFAVGTVVENYYGNGVVSANAVVVLNTPTNNTSGTMVVVPVSGNVATDATISLSGNSVTAVIDTFTDSSATGNVMYTSNTSISVFNTTNQFVTYPGNYIVGLTSNTYANVSVRSTGTSAKFSVGGLTNEQTVLIFSDLLRANNTGNVAFMSVLLDGSNSNVAANGYGFPKYPAGDINTTLQNILRFSNKTIGEISVLTGINPGDGYNADPRVVILEPEVAALDKHDLTIKLTNLTGLFVPGEIVEASSNSVGQQVEVTGFTGTAANGASMVVPEIGEYVWQSNGTANTATGFVYQSSVVAGSGSIKISDTTGTFVNTYSLQTLTTNASATIATVTPVTLVTTATGSVKTSNSSAIAVKRLNLTTEFYSNQNIVGKLSGSSATILDAAADYSTLPVGENAVVSANVQVANTVVSALEVVDSGFGYVQDETVSMSLDGGVYDVTARVVLNDQGQSEGYYETERGFVDGSSKIHDGEYYQEYSYEVRARIPLEKYSRVLKDVVHTAGTTFFGKVIFDSYADYEDSNLIPVIPRQYNVNVVSGNGTYVVGEKLIQSTANGVYKGHTGVIVIANSAPYIESNTQISTPSFSGNTSSATVVAVTSNATHSTLYTSMIEGTIDTGVDIEAVIGRELTINNIQQGNTVTGSFAVGEIVYQSNTMGGTHSANGTVVAANNTLVEIWTVSGTWTANSIVYGATSNAYANTAAVNNASNTYTVITSINTLHIANVSGQFVQSSVITGANSGATSNASYISITLDT